MKISIRRWLGFAALPITILLFGLSGQAHAQTITTCDDIDTVQPTDALTVVQTSGDCIIDNPIAFDGNISITVLGGGSISSKAITSNNGAVFLTATDNDVSTRKIEAGTSIRVLAGVNLDSTLGTAGTITIDGDVIANSTNRTSGNANIMLRAFG